jgi:hypothetical protein
METNKRIGFTVRIPVATYNTLLEYKKRFKPHLSLNSLIVESIIEEVKSLEAGSGAWNKTAACGDRLLANHEWSVRR